MTLSPESKKTQIAEKMGEILTILGLDLSDASLAQTPQRIATMYVDEIFSSLEGPLHLPEPIPSHQDIPKELIFVKDVSFVSFCEHHFVPIVGKVHVAYYPNQFILGLSKIPHIVRYFAKQPQLQERLTAQVAETLISVLQTDDVAVAIQAMHFCVAARGVEDLTAEMETHILRGRFETDPLFRSQFFSCLPQKH